MSLLQPITPRLHDLGGGFRVRRLLPSAPRRSVGPFVFFDHFGPATAQPDDNHDVRPHPHVGLATVTYLFDGAMMHRDSIGAVQRIEPGAINWMTSGRGIVHSERTPEDLKHRVRAEHGLQLWTALPVEHEEVAPAFDHTASADLPETALGGARVRVLVGRAFAAESPVRTLSPTLYLDLHLAAGASLTLEPGWARERAVYGIDAPFRLGHTDVEPQTMLPLPDGEPVRLEAQTPARVVLVGGDPLGDRFIWWNFVGSSRQRIEQAADDWRNGRFPGVPGESEFIPLPDRRLQ